jgi:hypothetical protein
MLWTGRPTINTDVAIVFTGFQALYVATVALPTYGLHFILIKEQLEITFMRFQMVRHCAACVIPALLKVSTAAAVLALGCVAHQCLSPEWLPMFGTVKRAICLCFGTPFFAHFILYIVYC